MRRRISQDSGVPAGHHEFDRTILGLGLLGDLKAFLGGGSQNRVQGVALGELGEKTFNWDLLLPQIKVGDQLIGL